METLVIDDDLLVRKILLRQLTTLGISSAYGCGSAHEALDMLSGEDASIDLILCDLQMPEMDGVEFIRHLVRMNYQGRLVLVSGEDSRLIQAVERLANAHKLKLLGALRKPVSIEEMDAVLKREVGPRKKFASSIACDPRELELAIHSGQLVMQYQPQVRFDNGDLAGVESLVRWNHPEKGLVMPDYFIPTAENSGLIDELTRAVLRTALTDAHNWRQQGLSIPLAVNVSMDNLCSLDFPDVVQALLTATHTAATDLMLEITESRLMNDISKSLDVLTRLRLKRIGLSIDDFGTGHSSLAQLRDVPFNELKIDRSFVCGAYQDLSLSTILGASLDMAHKLQMKTVAEGVEDYEDWRFLRSIGCQIAQGWFIAKPMDAKELIPWLDGWKNRCNNIDREVF